MTQKPPPVSLGLKKSRDAAGGDPKGVPEAVSRKGQAPGPADKPQAR